MKPDGTPSTYSRMRDKPSAGDEWATGRVLTMPHEQGEQLRRALLGNTHESTEVRNNVLRVAYLRVTTA